MEGKEIEEGEKEREIPCSLEAGGSTKFLVKRPPANTASEFTFCFEAPSAASFQAAVKRVRNGDIIMHEKQNRILLLRKYPRGKNK